MKNPCVYMMANKEHGTLYVGVTSNLPLRVAQHKAKTYPGFTAEYGLDLLVWYKIQGTMEAAIQREKQIKKYARAWKTRLIAVANPEWLDLAGELG